MQNIFLPLADWLANSPLRSLAIEWLRNIPGLPPILQSIHIVAVAVVMASAILIHLRVLSIAVRGQDLQELVARMRLWFWWALPVLLFSGLLFVFARPYRYFKNPVFGIKMLAVILAVSITAWAFKKIVTSHPIVERPVFKLMNGLALLGWITVVFGGRWIAYVEYLVMG